MSFSNWTYQGSQWGTNSLIPSESQQSNFKLQNLNFSQGQGISSPQPPMDKRLCRGITPSPHRELSQDMKELRNLQKKRHRAAMESSVTFTPAKQDCTMFPGAATGQGMIQSNNIPFIWSSSAQERLPPTSAVRLIRNNGRSIKLIQESSEQIMQQNTVTHEKLDELLKQSQTWKTPITGLSANFDVVSLYYELIFKMLQGFKQILANPNPSRNGFHSRHALHDAVQSINHIVNLLGNTFKYEFGIESREYYDHIDCHSHDQDPACLQIGNTQISSIKDIITALEKLEKAMQKYFVKRSISQRGSLFFMSYRNQETLFSPIQTSLPPLPTKSKSLCCHPTAEMNKIKSSRQVLFANEVEVERLTKFPAPTYSSTPVKSTSNRFNQTFIPNQGVDLTEASLTLARRPEFTQKRKRNEYETNVDSFEIVKTNSMDLDSFDNSIPGLSSQSSRKLLEPKKKVFGFVHKNAMELD